MDAERNQRMWTPHGYHSSGEDIDNQAQYEVMLDHYVLTLIFQYLDIESKCQAAQVCRIWRRAINQKFIWKNIDFVLSSQNCHLLEYRSLKNKHITNLGLLDFRPGMHEFLQRIPTLDYLYLTNTSFNNFTLSFLRKFTLKLKGLNVSHCYVVDDFFFQFIVLYLPFLKELNLTGCINVTCRGMRILSSGMKNLRVLTLNRGKSPDFMSDEIISGLIGLSSLEELYLSKSTDLTDNALKDIGLNFLNLIAVDLSHCIQITDVGIYYLTSLKKLIYLNLLGCNNITDTGMISISQLSTLRFVNLTGSRKLSHAGFQHISKLTNLKHLNLNLYVGSVDSTLKVLANFTTLQKLIIINCAVSDQGLLNLSNGNLRLTTLVLRCENIGDKGIAALCNSSFTFTLRTLQLGLCSMPVEVAYEILLSFWNLTTLMIETEEKDGNVHMNGDNIITYRNSTK